MKILMVNNYNYLRGGSERVMFEEMGLLRRAGHEVAAFSARDARNAPSPLEHLFPVVPELSQLGTVGKLRHVPRLISNGSVKKAFVRALQEFRPDVVHLHNIYGRLTPIVADVARGLGIPSVMTAHDYKLICASYLRLDKGAPCSACSYGRYGPALVRGCHKGSRISSFIYGVESAVNVKLGRYDGIAAFLCPSRFMLESFAGKGVERARLRYVPNFVDDSAIPESLTSGSRYLLYAGRLSREKGVACLLRAMRSLDVELAIAGDGPESERLRRMGAELGIASKLRFLGHCDGKKLGELIAGALCVVVPSECFENAPMAILEAFGAAKPVVGASIGGIPELVVEGETGRLFPPGEHARLAEVLAELIASPAAAREMGANARRFLVERFSSEAHLRALLMNYREAMT